MDVVRPNYKKIERSHGQVAQFPHPADPERRGACSSKDGANEKISVTPILPGQRLTAKGRRKINPIAIASIASPPSKVRVRIIFMGLPITVIIFNATYLESTSISRGRFATTPPCSQGQENHWDGVPPSPSQSPIIYSLLSTTSGTCSPPSPRSRAGPSSRPGGFRSACLPCISILEDTPGLSGSARRPRRRR